MRAEYLIRRIHCLSALHHHAANIQTFLILPNFFKFMCLGCLALGTARQSGHFRDTLYFYFFNSSLQYPSECCPFIKNFFLYLWVRRFLPSDITYCESVFRKSLSENVEVFLIRRAIRNNTHFRIDTCGRSRSAYPYPMSIRVWGIVSFISNWVFPQPSDR